ncbi:MAG: TetR/AcrR family transcriptional regulator [Sphingomonadaceae bacterium]|nr:TetR/AcrR family transcriptional regulator [Sphingomonadaceae bacterium]
MTSKPARKRIPAPERREMLLRVARKLFAELGFERTKTSQIAAEADVSEALLYRHFPSKEALYREVLRETLREQDEMYDLVGVPEPSSESLVLIIREFLSSCVGTPKGGLREGLRIMLASLSGDGSYAGQVYRRAMRKQLAPITAALTAAEANGDLDGHRLAPESVAMMVEHVGTMISAGLSLPGRSTLYPADSEQLLDDATWFCCRGLGLSSAAITRCLAATSGNVVPLAARRRTRS